MTKPPAFQFYASDFLASTVDMTGAEVGAYVRALCWSWDHGPIPKKDDKLARIMQVQTREFQLVWPAVRARLTSTPKGYINKRLEVEREKQAIYREKQANKGRASAKQRLNRGSAVVQPEPQPDINRTPQLRLQPESNSPSPSPEDQDPQDQDPGASRGLSCGKAVEESDAPLTVQEVEAHLLSAGHSYIEANPFCEESELRAELKTVAGRCGVPQRGYSSDAIRPVLEKLIQTRKRRGQQVPA